jgi:hypothetical protein
MFFVKVRVIKVSCLLLMVTSTLAFKNLLIDKSFVSVM